MARLDTLQACLAATDAVNHATQQKYAEVVQEVCHATKTLGDLSSTLFSFQLIDDTHPADGRAEGQDEVWPTHTDMVQMATRLQYLLTKYCASSEFYHVLRQAVGQPDLFPPMYKVAEVRKTTDAETMEELDMKTWMVDGKEAGIKSNLSRLMQINATRLLNEGKLVVGEDDKTNVLAVKLQVCWCGLWPVRFIKQYSHIMLHSLLFRGMVLTWPASSHWCSSK